ncbi:hypothetical protein KIN20_016302 [Parelaphostrongylus tenuis]|uniref:Uncharacterized protein n=1 Tax=Parelaphostrongylus tenuis TaxID=148309 RepID=A0AAD5QMV5_PARTN|nr:hypothetical protein KIN20_016302 [Parelaphostrongylus tenuis]
MTRTGNNFASSKTLSYTKEQPHQCILQGGVTARNRRERANHSMNGFVDWTQSHRQGGDTRYFRIYQPLLSILYKLSTKIILLRLWKTLGEEQPAEQAGFLKGSCCVGHIQAGSRSLKSPEISYVAYSNSCRL